MPDETQRSDRMDAMYSSHFKAVRAYCMRRLPVSEANDAVADVFLTAWRRIDDVPIGAKQLPYLYGIARNTVMHSRRSRGRRLRLQEKAAAAAAPDGVTGPEAAVIARAEAEMLDAALFTLRESDRELIRLRAWEELAPAEIAEILGISTAAARKRLARAVEKLGIQLHRQRRHVPASHRKEARDE